MAWRAAPDMLCRQKQEVGDPGRVTHVSARSIIRNDSRSLSAIYWRLASLPSSDFLYLSAPGTGDLGFLAIPHSICWKNRFATPWSEYSKPLDNDPTYSIRVEFLPRTRSSHAYTRVSGEVRRIGTLRHWFMANRGILVRTSVLYYPMLFVPARMPYVGQSRVKRLFQVSDFTPCTPHDREGPRALK